MTRLALVGLVALCIGADPQPTLEFDVADDLVFEEVLSAPDVRQPVFMNFDERGRLWVVEYLQYPNPNGVKVLSRDRYWRAVYDRMPEPPPHGPEGEDRISIYDDTDGDGRFERVGTFLDNLNIATACAHGRGGVWVLSPPHLLFYPDADRDDTPDGDPVVHLEGFGLEDTHSVVNSLRWGPDGWLYAAQGSTVTANVKAPADKGEGRFTQGQLVWRYHPETARYEVFAEGGGNAFGVEIDAEGEVFSGHNGGNTRGFHYVQGGYLQKGFSKHGPLSNPFAFGYFPPMPPDRKVPRFTHNFVIAEGHTLPKKYDGHLIGIEPLQGRLVEAKRVPVGSTFRTEDVSHPVVSARKTFRPVDIKAGPDGAIYVADFEETYIAHSDHYQDRIERDTGRIYRLRSKTASRGTVDPVGDLAKRTSEELLELLHHPNKWHRQTALRLIGDRKDQTLIEPLTNRLLQRESSATAREWLWALNLSGGLTAKTAATLLDHPDPVVRRWVIRLIGDRITPGESVIARFGERAASETDPVVRCQLAATARRLQTRFALPIVSGLLTHPEDASEPYIPLMTWWVIEDALRTDADAVMKWLPRSGETASPVLVETILPRLMRRLASTGKRSDLLRCATLFREAESEAVRKGLLNGFEEAFRGRIVSGLPDELVTELAKLGRVSLALRVRQRDSKAINEALAIATDPKAKPERRRAMILLFGEVPHPPATSKLLTLLDDRSVREAVLGTLQRYSDAAIPTAVLSRYESLTERERDAALALLASRPPFAKTLLTAIEQGTIEAKVVPMSLVSVMRLHDDAELQTALKSIWPADRNTDLEQAREQVQTLLATVNAGEGDVFQGREEYRKVCAKCHRLLGEGGDIGPDLTPYNRRDLSRLLTNIVAPSAEIREGYETVVVVTIEGRTVTGFVVDRDPNTLTLRSVDGQRIELPTADIDETLPQKLSLMPKGLLANLDPQQVRDLLAYLRQNQPLPQSKPTGRR